MYEMGHLVWGGMHLACCSMCLICLWLICPFGHLEHSNTVVFHIEFYFKDNNNLISQQENKCFNNYLKNAGMPWHGMIRVRLGKQR